jgi:putative transposase
MPGSCGSRGGSRPSLHAQRNTIERGFGRLKQWRGIAARHDKYALISLGGTLLAAIVRCGQ